MATKVNDALHLQVLWHLHEAQGYFCHRDNRSSEDWIRGIVEFIIEVAWGMASMLSSSGPAFSFTLIPYPTSCASSFILILRSILNQIVL
jgi:hypothetical protein